MAVSADVLAAAGAALGAGGLVVYPTETFYGIGARALSVAAVDAVAALKARGVGDAAEAKPIALILADPAMLDLVVSRVPPPAATLMARFWPGPLTLVLPARSDLPDALTVGTGHVGVRVSSHPVARALSAAIGEPVTATSANRAGEAPACDVDSARRALGGDVGVYVDGGVVAGGLGSTVLLVGGDAVRVVRAGAISVEALRDALGTFPLVIPS